MTHAFGSIDELGEGYGFRKIRKPLGVKAFGVNASARSVLTALPGPACANDCGR